MGILRTNKISGLETPTAVTGSVEFDGTGKAVSFPAGNDFAYGTGDFTIEGWFYTTVIGQVSGASASSHIFFGQTVSGTNYLLFGIDDNGKLLFYNTASGGGSDLFSSAPDGSVVLNKWQHIALCRSSGTLRAFVDGSQVISISNTFDFSNTDRNPTIGNYTHTLTTQPFNGYVSNFRILKGTALYTSDFTVPTHELEVIGDTVLLCCNNPDSAGAEATGKTATVSGSAPASTFSPGLTRDFTFGTEFRGVTTFDTQGYFVPPSGTTEQRGRGRGLFGGGGPGSGVNTINYITIASMSNAQDFGDLTQTRLGTGSVASSTRAVFMTGYSGGNVDTMDFVTIATTGNAVDFGNLADDDRHEIAGVSNQTRGMVGGGQGNSAISDRIDYITIASIGDSIDFGNLTLARRNPTGVMSPTRGVFCGGRNNTPAPSTQQEEMDYVTIATTGNALDFGDLTVARGRMGSVCSSTRGVIGGGNGSPADSNVIDYITIASTGNAQDFGDMINASEGDTGGCSNSLRGVFGGHNVPAGRNILEYVTIASTGDALDFGDLTYSTSRKTGCSDSHGGLS